MRPAIDPAAAEIRQRPKFVFVGGTGRSGTHALSKLLSRQRYALVPIESRFHVNPQGFPDLLAERVTPEQFVAKLRSFWWHRIEAGSPLPAIAPRLPLGRSTRGLHKTIPRERFETSVERFQERARTGALEVAARGLFIDLLWPLAEQADRFGLVEMSTHTVASADFLARLFPDSKLVHIVRDGRDAGSSKVSRRQKAHHPRDVAEGVDWWLGRLERAERAVARAPQGYVLTLSLDDLVAGEREATYKRLLDFVRLSDVPSVREHFDRKVNERNASRGRWRRGLSEAQQREVVAAYERALDHLTEQGFPSGPLLRDVYERLG